MQLEKKVLFFVGFFLDAPYLFQLELSRQVSTLHEKKPTQFPKHCRIPRNIWPSLPPSPPSSDLAAVSAARPCMLSSFIGEGRGKRKRERGGRGRRECHNGGRGRWHLTYAHMNPSFSLPLPPSSLSPRRNNQINSRYAFWQGEGTHAPSLFCCVVNCIRTYNIGVDMY